VGKVFAAALPVLILGWGPRVAVIVGISLAQIGEFAFVLLEQGRIAGLVPPDVYQVTLAATIISMAATPFLFRLAHAAGARAAIVVLSDPPATRRTLRLCRTLSSSIFLLARTRYLSEVAELSALGADEVVAEEFETSLEIAARTLRRLGFPLPWVESETAEIRGMREDAFRRFRAPDTAADGVERALGGARLELLSIGPGWAADGRSLKDLALRESGGAIVLAAVRRGEPEVAPRGDF